MKFSYLPQAKKIAFAVGMFFVSIPLALSQDLYAVQIGGLRTSGALQGEHNHVAMRISLANFTSDDTTISGLQITAEGEDPKGDIETVSLAIQGEEGLIPLASSSLSNQGIASFNLSLSIPHSETLDLTILFDATSNATAGHSVRFRIGENDILASRAVVGAFPLKSEKIIFFNHNPFDLPLQFAGAPVKKSGSAITLYRGSRYLSQFRVPGRPEGSYYQLRLYRNGKLVTSLAKVIPSDDNFVQASWLLSRASVPSGTYQIRYSLIDWNGHELASQNGKAFSVAAN